MPPDIRAHLEKAMGRSLVGWTSCSGGDAASAYRGELADGTRVFVKTALTGSPFRMEALGLQQLREAGGVRTPDVLHVDDDCLVLEWIEFGSPGPGFQTRLGRELATTHRSTADAYGFDGDHAIGLSPQKNLPWIPDTPGAWAAFWWSHRLEPMIRKLPTEEARAFARLEPRVDDIVSGTGEAPSILHGDLWSGNVAADASGAPVLFDPAPYYGHREADLSMTRMFGGFTDAFYRTYDEAFPLEEGWRQRLDFYMLYHVLNHWILFGAGYRSRARSILHDYL